MTKGGTAIALIAIAVVACEKKPAPEAVDASVSALASTSVAAPKLEEVALDARRVRPCRIHKLHSREGAEAVECAHEWAANQPTMKGYNPNPRWLCKSDAKSWRVVFEPRPGQDFPLAEVSVDRALYSLTREPNRDAGPGRPVDCEDQQPPRAEPYVAPTPVGPPPSVEDAIRAATSLVHSQNLHLPGSAKVAGTCALPEPTLGCEGLGKDRLVLFTNPPGLTFFVRVDSRLNARFDEPFEYSKAKPTPWIGCKCESLPGFHVAP